MGADRGLDEIDRQREEARQGQAGGCGGRHSKGTGAAGAAGRRLGHPHEALAVLGVSLSQSVTGPSFWGKEEEESESCTGGQGLVGLPAGVGGGGELCRRPGLGGFPEYSRCFPT